MERRDVGIGLDRGADHRRSLFTAIRLMQNDPEKVKRIGVVRVLRQDLAIGSLGVGEIAGLLEPQGKLNELVGLGGSHDRLARLSC